MIQFEEQELMLSKDFVERTIDLERGRSPSRSPKAIPEMGKSATIIASVEEDEVE